MAARAPDEGRTFNDGGLAATAEVANQNNGSLADRPARDMHNDYPVTSSHSGTDISAGREFADRMPEAALTETDKDGRPIDR